MASSVDECVGKFQCMLDVSSKIVSTSGTTNACWLAWNQNERHPSTKAERQGWLNGASWWSWQMLNCSFLQLFLRGLSSLAFVSGEWMRIAVRYVSLAILYKMLSAYFSVCHHFFSTFSLFHSLQSKCRVIGLDQSNCRDFLGACPGQARWLSSCCRQPVPLSRSLRLAWWCQYGKVFDSPESSQDPAT